MLNSMKNLLFAILLFVSLFSFSQPIIINRTNYSVDQLVNQVLINSPCVSGFNVMSKNGNQFGSTNSIGYFENQNLNFPYAWMVYGMSQLKNVKLYIYNRYGKLLTQLNSKNESWDGTLNNAPLPADDYWFTISYTENGNGKEFKSHFTLKR